MLLNIARLFATFFKIGLFSIGGGYAILPMIKEQVVLAKHWLTGQEFTDIITISQMTPGPISVNTSSFVGIRVAGIPGAVAATVGCVISGFVISILLYRFFQKKSDSSYMSAVLDGLKASSLGLVLAAAFSILLLTLFGTDEHVVLSSFQLPAAILFGAAVVLLRKFKKPPVFVIIFTGIIGLLIY